MSEEEERIAGAENLGGGGGGEERWEELLGDYFILSLFLPRKY